jgi:hypothetical protein
MSARPLPPKRMNAQRFFNKKSTMRSTNVDTDPVIRGKDSSVNALRHTFKQQASLSATNHDATSEALPIYTQSHFELMHNMIDRLPVMFTLSEIYDTYIEQLHHVLDNMNSLNFKRCNHNETCDCDGIVTEMRMYFDKFKVLIQQIKVHILSVNIRLALDNIMKMMRFPNTVKPIFTDLSHQFNSYILTSDENSEQSNEQICIKCWNGYKRVPGTKPYSKGSCAKCSKCHR